MNRFSVSLTTAIIMSLIALPAGQLSAQDCGDMNGNGHTDVEDIIDVIEHIRCNGPIDSAYADIDDHFGITVADLFVFVNAICDKSTDRAVCNPIDTYTFTPTVDDTVYIPYFTGIAEDKNTVYLPLGTTFSLETHSAYIALLAEAAGSNGVFEFDSVINLREPMVPWSDCGSADTVLHFAALGCWPSAPPQGKQVPLSLRYVRVSAGEGDLVTAMVDRPDPLRSAVGKGSTYQSQIDLYIPVVVPVDVSFPMGDCNCDGGVNVADLICVIDFLFWLLPHCEPYLQPFGMLIMDIDCDGMENIADLTYLVSYLFQGGPPPCNPFR